MQPSQLVALRREISIKTTLSQNKHLTLVSWQGGESVGRLERCSHLELRQQAMHAYHYYVVLWAGGLSAYTSTPMNGVELGPQPTVDARHDKVENFRIFILSDKSNFKSISGPNLSAVKMLSSSD